MASRLELLEALNQLLDAWDPIGVLQVGNERESAAVDEYRSYATGILSMLEGGADVFRLTQHLRKLANESMGLTTSEAQHRESAQAIVDWWKRAT